MLQLFVGEARILFPFISIVGFLIFWFVIGILLCVWVYNDAESRRMNGGLWLIIVLISGPVGLIVYLIVRGEKRVGLVPPMRGRTRFCIHCGRELSLNTTFCPTCGKAVTE